MTIFSKPTKPEKAQGQVAEVVDVEASTSTTPIPNTLSQDKSSTDLKDPEEFSDAKSEASGISLSICSIETSSEPTTPSLFSTTPLLLPDSPQSFKLASLNLLVSTVNYGKATLSLIVAIMILLLITPSLTLLSLFRSHQEKIRKERELNFLERGEDGSETESKLSAESEDGPHVLKLKLDLGPLVKAGGFFVVVSKNLTDGGVKVYRGLRGGRIRLEDDGEQTQGAASEGRPSEDETSNLIGRSNEEEVEGMERTSIDAMRKSW